MPKSLRELLNDPDHRARLRVLRDVKSATGERAAALKEALHNDPNPSVREAALRALYRTGNAGKVKKKKKTRKQKPKGSVWTVSGGLPGLGKRR